MLARSSMQHGRSRSLLPGQPPPVDPRLVVAQPRLEGTLERQRRGTRQRVEGIIVDRLAVHRHVHDTRPVEVVAVV